MRNYWEFQDKMLPRHKALGDGTHGTVGEMITGIFGLKGLIDTELTSQRRNAPADACLEKASVEFIYILELWSDGLEEMGKGLIAPIDEAQISAGQALFTKGINAVPGLERLIDGCDV